MGASESYGSRPGGIQYGQEAPRILQLGRQQQLLVTSGESEHLALCIACNSRTTTPPPTRSYFAVELARCTIVDDYCFQILVFTQMTFIMLVMH